MKKLLKGLFCLCFAIMALLVVGCNPLAGDERFQQQDSTLKTAVNYIDAINKEFSLKISENQGNVNKLSVAQSVLQENSTPLLLFASVNFSINVNDGLIEIDSVTKDDDNYKIENDETNSIIEFKMDDFQYEIIDTPNNGGSVTKSVFIFDQNKQNFKCITYEANKIKSLFESVKNEYEYTIQIYNYQNDKLLKLKMEYRVEKLRWYSFEVVENIVNSPDSIFDNGVNEDFMLNPITYQV